MKMINAFLTVPVPVPDENGPVVYPKFAEHSRASIEQFLDVFLFIRVQLKERNDVPFGNDEEMVFGIRGDGIGEKSPRS